MDAPHPTRVVVCSLEPWDEVWRRNQYLVDALLREDPMMEVLFVEPPEDPVHALGRRRRPRLGRGLRTIDGYQERLRTLQPTKWLPRRFGSVSDTLMRRRLHRALRRLSWTAPLLWINDPGWARLVTATGWPSLYDITDDWVEAERGEREHDRLAAADAVLLAHCDEVVVCSSALYRSKGGARSLSLIRNAVDVARYRREHDRPADLPPVPLAVYAGTLHEDRLDVSLVLASAQRIDQIGGKVVLLGPNSLTAHNTARLLSTSAVMVLGSRPKDEVPAYLQHAHALIVPHVVDDFTDSLDPIKLYEYLAVGRPIVSTGVAGFRDEHGEAGITVADGERFADAVVSALSAWTPTDAHTHVPDWSERGQAMRTVIERLDAVRGEQVG
jgi:glycosyltransferase involved in cell wall biosynthesis